MIKYIHIIIISIILCNININNNKSDLNTKNNKNKIITKYKTANNSIHKKNVLLSLVVKYSWEIIFPFIKSFVNSKIPNCDFILFVQNISKSVVNKLKSFGIIVYHIPNNFKNTKIFSLRWKIYSEFLKNNVDKYNLVLSVDIRDTIIQKDLFSLYESFEQFLAFSFEDGYIYKLINNDWIINKFGMRLFETIKYERIINAGTVWGTIKIFIEFANILWDKLSIFPEAIDQTVINYLIYHEKILHKYLKFSDLDGPVMTVGLTKKGNLSLDSENNIINYNGKVASIVHQYDRHKYIKINIKNKLCPELIDKKNIKIIFILSEILSVILLTYLIKEKHKKRN